MARTNFTSNVVEGATGSSTLAPLGVTLTATAVDVTNGLKLTDFGLYKRVRLIFNNTHSASHVITIRAGAYPLDATPGPAFMAHQGDYTFTVAAGGYASITLDSARFEQADGSLYIDFDASTTGSVWALATNTGIQGQ